MNKTKRIDKISFSIILSLFIAFGMLFLVKQMTRETEKSVIIYFYDDRLEESEIITELVIPVKREQFLGEIIDKVNGGNEQFIAFFLSGEVGGREIDGIEVGAIYDNRNNSSWYCLTGYGSPCVGIDQQTIFKGNVFEFRYR